MKTAGNIENDRQRTGLNSILSNDEDIQMVNSQTQLKSVRKIPKEPFKVLDAPNL